jgi:(S)-citramalyl-CoA lyase
MISPRQRKSVHSLKSWLFTPGTKAERFGNAANVHADALIIDLEDAVAPSEKEEARDSALHYLEGLSSDHLPCALRINAPVTRVGLDDLQDLLRSSAQPDYIILPKTEASGVVGLVSTLLRQARKATEVIALIETARGAAALGEMTGADIKPAALLFGAADMSADLGAETAWEPLLMIRSFIVQTASTAGIAVLDSPYFDIADAEGLRRETVASANLGFHAKCAIHPAQIAVINEVLTPTADEVAKARQILVVNRQGVGSVGHQMVDEAVARTARLVLERAGVADQELVGSSKTK